MNKAESIIPENIIDRVLDHIDTTRQLALTRELIQINSVYDPISGSCEQPIADYIASWAEKCGFEVHMNLVSPGRSNVIIIWRGKPGQRMLMFEGHMDVVTPGDLKSWDIDPFGAEIIKGRLYGRGANDTKGNLAAMLIAMDAIKQSGVPLYGTIIGGVLCDEEGGMTGVQDFIRRGHADYITAAVICEPQDGMLCITQKGALRAEYLIDGHMSHGAMPQTGLNIAPAFSELITGLYQLEEEAQNQFGQDELLGWPSFTPTVIQAPRHGTAQLNVMPGEGCLLVDIRTVPGQSHLSIRKQLNALASHTVSTTMNYYQSKFKRLQIDNPHRLKIHINFLTDRPCTFTDRNDPIVQAADWATRYITKQPPVYGGVPGATDGTYLWAMKTIPIITMGAGDREIPHQANEWVDIEQLFSTARIYALTALNYLSRSHHLETEPA